MKKFSYFFVLSIALIFVACQKENLETAPVVDRTVQFTAPTLQQCIWNEDVEVDKTYERVEMIAVKTSEDCGDCYVAGRIQFSKPGFETIEINYGAGQCDNLGVKTVTCDASCAGTSYSCQFEIDCKTDG